VLPRIWPGSRSQSLISWYSASARLPDCTSQYVSARLVLISRIRMRKVLRSPAYWRSFADLERRRTPSSRLPGILIRLPPRFLSGCRGSRRIVTSRSGFARSRRHLRDEPDVLLGSGDSSTNRASQSQRNLKRLTRTGAHGSRLCLIRSERPAVVKQRTIADLEVGAPHRRFCARLAEVPVGDRDDGIALGGAND